MSTDNIWGLTDEMLEQDDIAQEQERSSRGAPRSGIYKAAIANAYLDKSDEGATSINIEMQTMNEDGTEGRVLYWTGWIRSRNSKGNKATYIDKNNGKERPLPSWHQFNALLRVADKKLTDLKPKPGKIEIKDTVKEVMVIPELIGTKASVVIQQYEDDYRDEIQVKYDVRDFGHVDGTGSHGETDWEDSWNRSLAKTPIKKLKPKAEAPKQETTQEAEEALAGW